jgi:hypothetical protein
LTKQYSLDVEESLKHVEFKSNLINFIPSIFTFINATYTTSNAKISALLLGELTPKEEEEVFLEISALIKPKRTIILPNHLV